MVNENKLIINKEQITPEKITNIFQRNGFLRKNRIEKVEIKNIQDTYSSRFFSLKLIYANDKKDLDEILNTNIYIKTSKEGFIEDNRKEALFYNSLKNIKQTEKKILPIPLCYDVAFLEESGRSHIILNDLSKTHIALENWPIPPSNEQCLMAVESMAKIHGFWGIKLRFKKLTGGLEKSGLFSWFEKQNNNLKRVLDSLGNKISLNRQKIYKKVYSSFPELIWRRFSHQNNMNLTLVHGDAHFWNFLYPKKNNNKESVAYLVDWQNWECGIGMQDLAYMIGLHWYPERRNLLEKKLIKHYYNVLIEINPDLGSFYNWEQCWYDYRLSIIRSLYIPILQCSNNIFPGVWWHHLERGILAFNDLNCIELLD